MFLSDLVGLCQGSLGPERSTVKPLIKVTLFIITRVRGRLFWRLENYIEVSCRIFRVLSFFLGRPLFYIYRGSDWTIGLVLDIPATEEVGHASFLVRERSIAAIARLHRH